MLTTGEIAKLFQITSQTVINWLEEGRMPFDRVGPGPRRVTEMALLHYIQQTKISPDSLDPELYAKILKAVGMNRDSAGVPGVAVLDRSAHVVSWNEGMTRLFGQMPREMLGRPIDNLPTQIEGRNGGIEYQLNSGWQGNSLRLRARCKNRVGQEIRCVVDVSRIYAGEGGERFGHVLVFAPER